MRKRINVKRIVLLVFLSIKSIGILNAADLEKYKNEEVGFEFQFPKTITIRVNSYKNIGQGEIGLRIFVDNVNQIEAEFPIETNKENAIRERAEILNNDLDGDPFKKYRYGMEIVELRNTTKAKTFFTLQAIRDISLVFDRTIIFYKGNYRVIMILDASSCSKLITEQMDSYFENIRKSQPNISYDYIYWRPDEKGDIQDTINDFIELLRKGNGSGKAQEWYDVFDEILASIIFYED